MSTSMLMISRLYISAEASTILNATIHNIVSFTECRVFRGTPPRQYFGVS